MKNRLIKSTTATAIVLSLLLVSGARGGAFVVNPALATADDANPGSDAQPFKTISRAAALVQPGDIVRIHSGVYRESVTIKQSGTEEQPIRFEAAPGATVVVTGADLLTGWRKDGEGDYSVDWPHKLFQGDSHNPGGAEQVFVNGVLLRKAPRLEEMAEGCFYVDLKGKRLHLRASGNPDENRAKDLHGILTDMQRKRLSLRQMATELTAMGIVTPRGGRQWNHSTVAYMLGRV